MNIGERFYCSKCMLEIEEEGICPHCGYDPMEETERCYLEEGTLLHGGRYQLGAVNGRGGFGITYAAWDLVLEMPVAVKEYFPAGYCARDILASDQVQPGLGEEDLSPEGQARPDKEEFLYYQLGLQTFSREARILAALLNIKTVVEVYDCFEENGTAYIIMEFVRGKTLAEYCKSEQPSVRSLLRILRKTIDDLLLVHRAGVLHRDISPENLLVQKDGTVKLIDFGASLKIDREAEKNFCLNRGYAALEQYDPHGRQGGWTDVYGLSATLYTLISGQPLPDAAARLENDQVKPLRKKGIRIKRSVSKAIQRGLSVKAEKRTQSMEEFRAELYHLEHPVKTRRWKAMRILKIAAWIAALYASVFLIVKNKEDRYLRQFELAARAFLGRDADIAHDLAVSYVEGLTGKEHFPENKKLSAYWFEWAAKRGNVSAMYDYACLLQAGWLAKKDIPQAVSYYEKAAEAGVTPAMNALGCLYLDGTEVEQDTDLAYHYLEQASSLGNIQAMTNLGVMYLYGKGIKADEARAARCFRIAAEKGEPLASFQLGLCYGNGTGVAQSDWLCYKYCHDAAIEGVPEAMCWMGDVCYSGALGFQDLRAGGKWYQKSAEAGNVMAKYKYAMVLKDGYGVRKDEKWGSALMLEAANRGSKEAEKEVKKMREEGFGIFGEEGRQD